MNWYKLFKIAYNDIRGEFWIDDSGTATDAGPDGDYNHEGYARESVQYRFMDGENWEEYKESLVMEKLSELCGELKTYVQIELCKEQHDEDDLLDQAIKEIGMTDEEFEIAEGHGDARSFAMKNWGWKRLEGNNVETWNLTEKDLKIIGDGLYDAYYENVDNATFNIYVYSNKKWFSDIPWSAIEEMDFGAIARNKHLV